MTIAQLRKLENNCLHKLPRIYSYPIAVPNQPLDIYCKLYASVYQEYAIFKCGINQNMSDSDLKAYIEDSFTRRLVLAVQGSRICPHNEPLSYMFNISLYRQLGETINCIAVSQEMETIVQEYQNTHDESVFQDGGEPLPRDMAWRSSKFELF